MRILLLIISATLLVACQSGPKEKKDTKALWEDVSKANQKVEDYHVVMDSQQNMHVDEKTVSANAAIDMYILEGPYSARQTINAKLDDEQSPIIDLYINDDFVYMKEPYQPGWSLLQSNDYKDVKENIRNYEDHLQHQIRVLKKYATHYTVTQTPELIKLSIDDSDKKFKTLYLSIIQHALPDNFKTILETVKIQSGKVDLEIDRETHQLRKVTASAVYDTKVQGIEAVIEQTVLAIYTKQNKTKLYIDQEEIDKAEIL